MMLRLFSKKPVDRGNRLEAVTVRTAVVQPEHSSPARLVEQDQQSKTVGVGTPKAIAVHAANERQDENIKPRRMRAEPAQRGGLRWAAEVIDTTEQIGSLNLPFQGCVNKEVGLSNHHYSNIAIVSASANAKTAILLLTDKVDDDLLAEIGSMLRNKGWSLPESGAQAWRASTQVVGSVSQGHVDKNRIGAMRDIYADKHRSSLFRQFTDVIQWAFNQHASDVDFRVNLYQEKSQIAFKIDGFWEKPPQFEILTASMLEMLGTAWQSTAGGFGPDFQIHTEQQALLDLTLMDGIRMRLRWQGMSMDVGGVVTMRLQPLSAKAQIQTLDNAGCLPWHIDTLLRVISTQGGLVTLAGQVDSGKSVLLSILMKSLPENLKHVEISDPVEIENWPHILQKTVRRNLVNGEDGDHLFESAVMACFRSSLDTLLQGEIRDSKSGLVARAIMESGHTVFTTIHAPDAIGVFWKYVSPQVGMPLDVLSTPGNIKLNVYQKLIRKLCVHCALSPDAYADRFLKGSLEKGNHAGYFSRLENLYALSAQRFHMRNPLGCEHCRNEAMPSRNGYHGRTLVMEMVEPDEYMCELLQEGNRSRVELPKYWRSLASDSFDDPNLEGKTAMECAIYKAQMGLVDGVLDPRDIESHFMSFETVERKRHTGARAAQFRTASVMTKAVISGVKA
jgi:type II secretory ATPase GspE/PulE/Tfp pilus assembly ATPase PilB-like protein